MDIKKNISALHEKRDQLIWEAHLESLKHRQPAIAKRFGLSVSHYKAVVNRMKKLHGSKWKDLICE